MILCSQCGAANTDGSAYCLDCGTELTPQNIGAPVAAPMDDGLAGAPTPEVRCSSCGAQNTIQDTYCRGCGGRLDYAPAPATSTGVPVASTPGAVEEAKDTAFFGAAQSVSRARLVLIRGEGFEGASFDLNADHQLAGRVEGQILFPDDEYLSPAHAEFFFREDALIVRDRNSLNGVYRKIAGRQQLKDGDHLVIGEQVFRLVSGGEVPPLFGFVDPADETMHLGSAVKDVGPFAVEQLLRGGQLGNVFYPAMGEMTVGREGCDLNFPTDGHLSRQHARLFLDGETVMLQDMNSKNGTFLRLREDTVLTSGDLVFLGHQVLRVEIVSR